MQLSFRKLLCPPGRHQGMGRTRDGVLFNAKPWSKESKLIVTRLAEEANGAVRGEGLHDDKALSICSFKAFADPCERLEHDVVAEKRDAIPQG